MNTAKYFRSKWKIIFSCNLVRFTFNKLPMYHGTGTKISSCVQFLSINFLRSQLNQHRSTDKPCLICPTLNFFKWFAWTAILFNWLQTSFFGTMRHKRWPGTLAFQGQLSKAIIKTRTICKVLGATFYPETSFFCIVVARFCLIDEKR